MDDVTLTRLPVDARGIIGHVDWARLSDPEAKRLRELGVDEGVEVELIHAGRWGGGPIACRVGRMTIAIRRRVADAVTVHRID
jgi:ferrous iron transport protein A